MKTETQRHSIGRDEAIRLAETKWWEHCTAREIAMFQMFTAELCCPFGVFHEAMEKALGHPIWTHEFAMNYDRLAKELLGEATPLSFSEVLELIPEDKRIVLVAKEPQ